MKKIKYLIGLITAVLAFTSYSVMAADAVVKEAYFRIMKLYIPFQTVVWNALSMLLVSTMMR
jgi:hypothetical protein